MKGAWVTLATNDSYSLGALVLAHSLRQVGTTQELAILVTPGVTNSMRTRLSEVFNLVKEVNVLDSRDQSNLRLLQRPELGITFTKLHCWQLTQYEKCVFLDADTMVLQNCDELFDREEFSAAPDVGWPDCFNSGVFVYRPSEETYDKLIQFALEKGSFDGGDQGLLNLFFSDWSHKDISKHLPFIYNVCSTAFYSYLPAFKQFGKDVKILHFIGNAKPWLQYFDTATRRVRPSGDVAHLSHILQKWWDIFCHMVHPSLSPDMCESYPEIVSESTPPQSLQTPYIKPDSPTRHSCETQNVWDPWEEYDKNQQNLPSINTEPFESHNTRAFSFSVNELSVPFQTGPSTPTYEYHDTQTQQHNSNLDNSKHFGYFNVDANNSESHSELTNKETQQHNSNLDNSKHFEYFNVDANHSESHSELTNKEQTSFDFSHHDDFCLNVDHDEYSFPVVTTGLSKEFSETPPNLEVPPEICEIPIIVKYDLSPSDDSSMTNRPSPDPLTIDPVGPSCPSENFTIPLSPISPEECETAASINKEVTERPNETEDSGLAGAFANLVLGQQRTAEQEALESNLRRQNWEQGNIDYLGKDSFDNIWRKICETLSKGPQKEKTAEGPETASPAATGDLNVGTEQQVEKETQPSQVIVTDAETSKAEHQPCETKESCVVPTPAEEIDTSPPKEDVCALSVSEKASEVVLEVTKIASSEPPSKTPTETPVEIISAPVIPSDVGPTPILSTLPQTDDVENTKEKEVIESASIQIQSAVKESPTTPEEVPEIAPVSTAILEEIVPQQSQLPEKTNETLPMIPQAPTKLEEANQVISVSEKPSEVLESECVSSKEESQDPNVAVPCVLKSPDTMQAPTLAEEQSSAPSPVAEARSSSDVKESSSIPTPTTVQVNSSQEVQIPTADEPTLISQTSLHGQSSDQSSISPRKDVTPSEVISPPGDISPPTKIASEQQSSPPKQITSQQIPAPAQISSQSQTFDKDLSAASTPSCTEKSVTSETPLKSPVESPVKIPTSPLKPDTSVQLESTSVKEIAAKESQTSKSHDALVSSQVPTEKKQAVSSPSANVEACPIAPPPRKSGGTKKQGKSKK